MPVPLYQTHSPSLSTLFGSIDGHVKAGAPVFIGAAGSIGKRRNQKGVEYYVHRFYGGAGTQQETYLGIVGEYDTGPLQAQIDEVKALVPELRLLVREGFQSADPKTYATLASLHLHDVFSAGATLIGSHAFGVLINQMGIRAAAYATEDVDVARWKRLRSSASRKRAFWRCSGIAVSISSRFLNWTTANHRHVSSSKENHDSMWTCWFHRRAAKSRSLRYLS